RLLGLRCYGKGQSSSGDVAWLSVVPRHEALPGYLHGLLAVVSPDEHKGLPGGPLALPTALWGPGGRHDEVLHLSHGAPPVRRAPRCTQRMSVRLQEPRATPSSPARRAWTPGLSRHPGRCRRE